MQTSDTGLFAVVARTDDRLSTYGLPILRDLLVPLNWFDKAHTVMLFEQGIISRKDATEILKVLEKVDELGPDGFPWGKGDLWAQKERYVIQQIGEDSGGRLHTGRSRQDVGCTVNRLMLRKRILDMARALNGYRKALFDVAERNIDTVMPCYTWMQHAQPTTLGHYLAAYVYSFSRDFDRMAQAFQLTNQSPAGAALQTGTSHPLDRQRAAELMGFDGVIRNTRDAVFNFDYLYEVLQCASMSVLDLLKLLEELTLWHSSEFNFVSLDDAWCGTSSIMPQKRNPYPFMTIRGKASKVLGRNMQAMGTLEAPCLGPSAPHYMERETLEAVAECIGIFVLAEGFTTTIQIHQERMLQQAASHWAQSTDLADTLVRESNLSFRTAHHVVAHLVAHASSAGLAPSAINTKLLDQAAYAIMGRSLDLPQQLIDQALDPTLSVRARKVYGGTAPEDVRLQLDECLEKLGKDEALVTECTDRIQRATMTLDHAIRSVVNQNHVQ